MVQITSKTLGVKKNMVYKLPWGGGKQYLARGLSYLAVSIKVDDLVVFITIEIPGNNNDLLRGNFFRDNFFISECSLIEYSAESAFCYSISITFLDFFPSYY